MCKEWRNCTLRRQDEKYLGKCVTEPICYFNTFICVKCLFPNNTYKNNYTNDLQI